MVFLFEGVWVLENEACDPDSDRKGTVVSLIDKDKVLLLLQTR